MPNPRRVVRDEKRRQSPAATDEEEVSAELAEVVRQLCAGLVRRHDLHGLARLAASWRLCRYSDGLGQNPWDDWRDVWASFPDGGLVWGLWGEEGTCALPYPHALLGWTDVVEGLPFGLTPRGTAWLSRRPGHEDATRADGTTWRAHGGIVAEVRLGILPVGPGGRLEAAFMTRLWTTVGLGELQRTAGGGLAYVPRVPGVAQDPVCWGVPQREIEWDHLRIRAEFGPGDYAQALRRFGWGDAARGYQHFVLPGFERDQVTRVDVVSPASCRRLTELMSAPSPLTGVEAYDVRPEPDVDFRDPAAITAYWRALEPESPPLPGEQHLRTPIFSLAEVLERGIFHAGPERGLDRVLDSACGSLAAEVRGHLEPIEESRELVKARLRARSRPGRWCRRRPPG